MVNLPFSFSLTNSGSSYRMPSSPNRLSIHPSYKWITGHIGDVSMNFSPYTLNGHMFTGAGVELSPDGWEFSAMYGRLSKAVEYDEVQPSFLPAYKRMGYGAKAGKISEKYQVSLNLFTAEDQTSSLDIAPDSFGITPMQNLAGGISFVLKPVEYIELAAEYGLSLITMDTRLPGDNRSGIVGIYHGSNASSTYYNALKVQANHVSKTSRFGIAYERIDPGYQTLGAYYFNNDLENITVNGSQTLWNNKLNIGLSLGYERDNLSDTKANQTSRIVGSFNATGTFGERVILNLAYTNFQTHTNMRSDFELINQEVTLDKLDTLNYVQLSQSANMNLNLITKKSEVELHNLNMTLAYQDAANKQGDTYHPGSVTEMINAACSYTLSFLKKGISLNGAVNINNSRVYNGNTFTWGPTLGISSQLLKKKLNTSISASYNTSKLENIKLNDVFMLRCNNSYTLLKRHNFTLSYSFLLRSMVNQTAANNSVVTAGYAYNF